MVGMLLQDHHHKKQVGMSHYSVRKVYVCSTSLLQYFIRKSIWNPQPKSSQFIGSVSLDNYFMLIILRPCFIPQIPSDGSPELLSLVLGRATLKARLDSAAIAVGAVACVVLPLLAYLAFRIRTMKKLVGRIVDEVSPLVCFSLKAAQGKGSYRMYI
jgi:hypothetical protein